MKYKNNKFVRNIDSHLSQIILFISYFAPIYNNNRIAISYFTIFGMKLKPSMHNAFAYIQYLEEN